MQSGAGQKDGDGVGWGQEEVVVLVIVGQVREEEGWTLLGEARRRWRMLW